jgi:hypothetical protein
MSPITSTNIRVGPGVYMALKEMADKTGLTIGTCADIMVVSSLVSMDKTFSAFTPDTQKALTADGLAVISEIFKIATWDTIKNTGFAETYKNLLSQPKK